MMHSSHLLHAYSLPFHGRLNDLHQIFVHRAMSLTTITFQRVYRTVSHKLARVTGENLSVLGGLMQAGDLPVSSLIRCPVFHLVLCHSPEECTRMRVNM